MIRKCSRADEEIVLSYIESGYAECLYLYLDLKKYGTESESVDVYIQENEGRISSVLLKYYTCLHVYSKDKKFDACELALFFNEGQFTMLYCESVTANMIFSVLPESLRNRTLSTNGWVAKITRVDKLSKGLAEDATDSDFDQIVKLIYSDEDIGKSYNYSDLAHQIKERNREGYSRNLVIKQDDIVLAHACTNAELDNIAIVAELIVKDGFRKQGFASEIWRDICQRLLSENKEVFSFYYSEESRQLHKHIGFTEVCNWTKLVVEG